MKNNVTIPSWLAAFGALIVFISTIALPQLYLRSQNRIIKLEAEVEKLKTTKSSSRSVQELREKINDLRGDER